MIPKLDLWPHMQAHTCHDIETSPQLSKPAVKSYYDFKFRSVCVSRYYSHFCRQKLEPVFTSLYLWSQRVDSVTKGQRRQPWKERHRIVYKSWCLGYEKPFRKDSLHVREEPTQFGLSVVSCHSRLDLAIHSNYLCIFISTYFRMKKAIKWHTWKSIFLGMAHTL